MDYLSPILITLLARRGRIFQKLWEGDPVAWTILIVVIVLMVGWSVIKSRMAKKDEGESGPDDESKSS
jgi:hypothetical protein